MNLPSRRDRLPSATRHHRVLVMYVCSGRSKLQLVAYFKWHHYTWKWDESPSNVTANHRHHHYEIEWPQLHYTLVFFFFLRNFRGFHLRSALCNQSLVIPY